MDESRWVALGQAVNARRLELGLSARAASTQAGINRATWAATETNANRLSRHLWAPVETVLRWQPGSIANILAGGGAITAQPTASQENDDRKAAEIERIRNLPLSREARLRMIRALIDVYAEAANEDNERPEHLAG